MKPKLFKPLFITFLIMTMVGCATETPPVDMEKLGNLQSTVRIDRVIGDDVKSPKPTVIISHGSSGVSVSDHDRARVISSMGYNTVVVNHYSGKGIVPGSHLVGTVVKGAQGTDRALDIIMAARWIKKQPWHKGKIAVIGYSQGGAGVNALASAPSMLNKYYGEITEEDLKIISAGVGVYPSCSPDLHASPAMNAVFPVQLHIAGDDDLAQPGWCDTIHSKNYEKFVYEGATHLWDVSVQQPITRFTQRYNGQVVELANSRIKDFLARTLRD